MLVAGGVLPQDAPTTSDPLLQHYTLFNQQMLLPAHIVVSFSKQPHVSHMLRNFMQNIHLLSATSCGKAQCSDGCTDLTDDGDRCKTSSCSASLAICADEPVAVVLSTIQEASAIASWCRRTRVSPAARHSDLWVLWSPRHVCTQSSCILGRCACNAKAVSMLVIVRALMTRCGRRNSARVCPPPSWLGVAFCGSPVTSSGIALRMCFGGCIIPVCLTLRVVVSGNLQCRTMGMVHVMNMQALVAQFCTISCGQACPVGAWIFSIVRLGRSCTSHTNATMWITTRILSCTWVPGFVSMAVALTNLEWCVA